MAERTHRWSKIDRLELSCYPYLDQSDVCYYLLERSRGDWTKGEANRIVSNFQRDPILYADRPEVLRYKNEAISYFANNVSAIISEKARPYPLVIVPMATSRPKGHQCFDDRLQQVAARVCELRPNDVVVDDVLDVSSEIPRAKTGGSRNPDAILPYITTRRPEHPEADSILLIDDVLTTGGHFAACKKAIQPLYPNARIYGIFLSRQQIGYEYGLEHF